MQRRHQIPRQHDAHDLADGVRGEHPADPEPVRNLEAERRLADAGRTPQQDDDGPLGILVLPPDQIPLGGPRPRPAPQDLVAETPQIPPLDVPDTAFEQIPLDLPGHVERLVGVDGRREQGLGEDPLREGPLLPRTRDADVDRQGEVALLLEGLVAEQLADRLDDLPLGHDLPPAEAVADRAGGAVGILEVHAARHQRVDHDAAHERTPASIFLDPDAPGDASAPGFAPPVVVCGHSKQATPAPITPRARRWTWGKAPRFQVFFHGLEQFSGVLG